MERWTGRVAVVTGASSGIGAEVSKQLVKNAVKVVGLARRIDRMKEMETSLGNEPGKFYAVKCDVTVEKEIIDAFKWVKDNLEGVDILVNCAGSALYNTLLDGPVERWRTLLDLNVLGLSICTKEAIQSMRERGVDDGHIIHMNWLFGHLKPVAFYMFAATKHALTALTEGYRKELIEKKSKIRVTSISPGATATEIRKASEFPEFIMEWVKDHSTLYAKDITDAIIFALASPPHVQIHEITMRSVGELF